MTTPLFNPYRDMPAPDLTSAFNRFGQALADYGKSRELEKAKEEAAAKELEYAKDVQRAFADGRPEAFGMLTLKYPGQREAIKQGWEMADEGTREKEYKEGVEIYSALRNGNVDIAKNMLDTRIEAMTKNGEDASVFSDMRQRLDSDPLTVQSSIGFTLSALDPERWGKVAKASTEMQRQGAELTESQAKAMKAAAEAKFAEEGAAADLEKKGWDIWKIQQDAEIARMNSRIAAMNAESSRQKNDIERQKIDQKISVEKEKRDQLVNKMAAEGQDKINTIRGGLSDIDELINMSVNIDPKTGKPVTDQSGNIQFKNAIKTATGPIQSRIPTLLSQETADFEAKVEGIKNKIALSNVDKLAGVLSDSDMKLLKNAVSSLELTQSPDSLYKSFQTINSMLKKGEELAVKRYGVPATEIPVKPSEVPPANAPNAGNRNIKVDW